MILPANEVNDGGSRGDWQHMSSARSLRIAVTADLHYGTRHTTGNNATEQISEYLAANRPDVILLGGDIGAGEDFQRCLARFDHIDCVKACVPGNHDVWVKSYDSRGDSRSVYEEYLPRVCREHGFHYLDQSPLEFPHSNLAIVGSMNWYDYSWEIDRLKDAIEDWQERLKSKRFSRGVHNDANFVKWPWNDESFTTHAYEQLQCQLQTSLEKYPHSIVITHHPSIRELLPPMMDPPSMDGLLWRAFSGNMRVEKLILKYADRIPALWCGHTHRAVSGTIGSMRLANIGGDYHFKRLHEFTWPSGELDESEFTGD